MMKEGGATPEERIAYAFRLVTARLPRARESKVLFESFQRFRKRYQAEPKAALEMLAEGESARDEQLDPVELASYAAIANLVLNLDKSVTKE